MWYTTIIRYAERGQALYTVKSGEMAHQNGDRGGGRPMDGGEREGLVSVGGVPIGRVVQ